MFIHKKDSFLVLHLTYLTVLIHREFYHLILFKTIPSISIWVKAKNFKLVEKRDKKQITLEIRDKVC